MTTDLLIGLVVAAIVGYGVYAVIKRRKAKKNNGTGGGSIDPRPPTHEK